jgi:nucleoside-diphosphate-sugar epimerase
MSTADIAREAGLTPVPVPGRPVAAAARIASKVPFTPPQAEWVEAMSNPPIMDASKAKRELGWTPRYSSREALRATLDS